MKEFILYPICKIVDYFIPTKGMPILLYHSISDTQSRLAVSIKDFEKQLRYLHEQGYKTIALANLLNGKKEKEKRVLITFDDGFKDNLTVALPILKQHGFVATVFISTDHIGGRSVFCRDEGDKNIAMLNADEIKELYSNGWTIASHFASHCDLDKLSDNDIKIEYERARNALKNIIENASAAIVSYPHSRYNEKVVRMVKSAGARLAFSGRIGLWSEKSDSFALPRIEIDRKVNFTKFKLYLSPTFNRLKMVYYEMQEVKSKKLEVK